MKTRIGVLTSGGDAQGMNAAVRAVVRSAITHGAEVYAIYEGYQGMIDGGDQIRQMNWEDVSAILPNGGTVIGTYRSPEFRTREGRLKAAANLLEHKIDRLVVIGGDGSLSGLHAFREEWPDLLAELVSTGQTTQEIADQHPQLIIAGLVGSIDNDLVGPDTTIGTDSALHRIVEDIDAINSTAASHQRSFVIEVMGRHCGYLALVSAIACGCDYVLVPEFPPEDGWEERMCAQLKSGREHGRRDSLVVVAEGAKDRHGNPITAEYVKNVIAETLQEDTRVTILGHVQRGGAPSAYDRWSATWLGYEAVKDVTTGDYDSEPHVLGMKGNQVARFSLTKAVSDTRSIAKLIEDQEYEAVMDLRGGGFRELVSIFDELANPKQRKPQPGAKRIGILHAGGLAPGMNAAARATVRLGINRGFEMVGIQNGFVGLRDGQMTELGWDDVEGWVNMGGAELGLRRDVPAKEDLYRISRCLEDGRIDGLIVIGGWNAYQATYYLHSERDRYPAFQIPMVLVPASIDNNLPGTEVSIGSDTALNVDVDAVDKLKMSGQATTRCFVVETMGRYCGYLALMTGVAGGAERVYLNEDGIALKDLAADVEWLRDSFKNGRKLFLAIRNERASSSYTTDVLAKLLEGESHGLYDVRTSIIGHVQQGAVPSAYDRLLATQMSSFALQCLAGEFETGQGRSWYIGLQDSQMKASPMAYMLESVDLEHRRPTEQWWLALRPVLAAMANSPQN